MSSITGIIDSVREVPLGTALSADAAIGATVLNVIDTTDFDARVGGTASLNGNLVTYTGVNDDALTVTISPGLTAAASADDFLAIWDTVNGVAAIEVRAAVTSNDVIDQGSAIDARVNLSLVPFLWIGDRDTGAGEVCECVTEDGTTWTLTDLPGVTAQVRGDLIKPASIPQSALGFTLPGGTKVTVSTTAPSSPNDQDIWVYVDATTPANNTMYKWNAGTSTWDTFQVGTNAIAAGSVTADLLAANSIVAGKIAAGALDAYSINSVSLSSGTMQGHVISSTITGTDFVMDSDNGRVLIYEQTATTIVNSTTAGTGSATVPAGVTALKIQAWGAGGGGGCGFYPNWGGAGGSGGEFASEPAQAVSPGDTVAWTIGAGGAGSSGITSGTQHNGGDSFVTVNGTEVCRAHGGLGRSTNSAGFAGGTGSTNSIHFDGGKGGDPSITYAFTGAGGGGSAGPASAGNAGHSPTGNTSPGAGGAAVTGGGAGGAGGSTTTGVAGSAPGGGGGGASTNGSTVTGGAGANGKVAIVYYSTTLVASIANTSGTDSVTGTAYPAGMKIHRADVFEAPAPTGEVKMFAGSTLPSGFLLCDGSAISRTTYSALFGVIGTTYGVGDGSTTFNLPDFGNHFPRGNTLGTGGGADTHTHSFNDGGHTHGAGSYYAQVTASGPMAINRVGVTAWTETHEYSATGQVTAAASASRSTAANVAGTSSSGTASGTTGSTSNVPVYTGVKFIIKT
jgi:microcystin-dependent protein